MPTNLNFTSLKADLANYLERGGSAATDPTVYAQIPRLINMAERKLAQDLKLLGQIEAFNSVPPSGGFQEASPVVAKPDRWRKTVSMNFGAGTDNNTRTMLFPRSLEYCWAYWPDPTQTETPEFYAEYDLQHWLIAPTPDAAYPFQVLCYMQPPLLDDTTQTNVWTDYLPDLLLYASLIEMAAFLKNDDRIPLWQQLWQQEMAGANGQDIQRILDRSYDRNAP